MSTIPYKLYLLSDAEVGSGLGSETINDIVARDHRGRPVLRGSHLKGLLRAQLAAMAADRGWGNDLADLCFGREGQGGDDGVLGLVRVADAHPPAPTVRTRSITRTRLTELGVAHGAALRTTEAVVAGTVFAGEVGLAPGAPAAADLAVRLSLLALPAIGGGRNRGGGACRVDLDGEVRSPGALLELLDAELREGVRLPARPSAAKVHSSNADTTPATVLRLVFRASDPICCPEMPVVGNNVIRAGLGVPASAVLGAVISRLAQADPALADATLGDACTRAWPLLPCAEDGAAGEPPVPVRVSLSHRMSKLADEQGVYTFKDAAIEPYDWRVEPSGSLLKGPDGVLLRGGGGNVLLWRSGDMPRLVTAHAVHHPQRNLFTVESLAPMVFAGWLSLPLAAADRLRELLQRDPGMSFGKARTVRGGGRLEAVPSVFATAFAGWRNNVFVLQSPAAIPDDWEIAGARAETVLQRLLRESGWGDIALQEREEGQVKVITQAACGVRFGWNRHGVGRGVDQTRRLCARRVFLPGTVFVLKEAPADLPRLLVRGLGVDCGGDPDGRRQGFGAVLPHPGIARERQQLKSDPPSRHSDGAGQWAMEWWRKVGERGPSASQIGAVAGRITKEGDQSADKYLERQKMRPGRVWDRWSRVWKDVVEKIKADPKKAGQALRTWQDLAIIHRNDKEN